ncbi:hypothetical protein I302_103895 [Kwoniella bestiolae CBS 10118]|uniref:SET domain-containing protein n=1 Tax=Kwoniella bestiolae CBS 10118 TaxID=1296100 RepID=A0A1B9G9P0_9TREE|nr:hypothetical protein I302_02601 [Kwoniella bestiolae CBS 10118]OCF27755.1 hypothetical protein I302_02601 [Kwoniella bestiolae CBS 10118]
MMLTTHSPPPTPEPHSRSQIQVPPDTSVAHLGLGERDIRRLVRETFHQTWKDYHAWKPPSTLAIINGELEKGAKRVYDELVEGHRKLGLELRKMVEDETNIGRKEGRFIGSRDALRTTSGSSTEHSVVYRKSSIPNLNGNNKSSKNGKAKQSTKVSFRSIPLNPTEGSYTYTPHPKVPTPISISASSSLTALTDANDMGEQEKRKEEEEDRYKIQTIPPYFFCSSGTLNICRDDEGSMPFIPIFNDNQDFDESGWCEMFDGRMAWEGAWRDPEVDIIQVETLSRILAKTNGHIASDQIDQTRILPLEVARIENLEISRDLPPFPPKPSISPTTGSNPVRPNKRKWNEPLPLKEHAQDVSHVDELGELVCSRQGCTIYGCLRHSSLEGNQLSLQSSSANQRPVISISQIHSKGRSSKLPMAVEGFQLCSEECYARFTVSQLYEAVSHPRYRAWSGRDLQPLIEIMSQEDEIASEDVCALSLMSNGFTCMEVAMQIIALTAEAEEPSIPTPSSEYSEVLSATKLTSPKKQIPRFLPVSNSSNTEECNHPGPCTTANCSCFAESWTCGRNCGCSSDCIRRDNGCKCRQTLVINGIKVTRGACTVERCPCAKKGRECDPELCGSCGAEAEIASARRYKYDHFHDRPEGSEYIEKTGYCGNVDLQKGVFPKLRVGISQVSGYGVFADEAIPKGRIIGEYIGEVISKLEGNRRDEINHQIGRQYIFTLNGESDIDAGNYGNITRFINSAKGQHRNINANTITVNNEARIVFTSTRPIKKDEEIRFDYGGQFDVNGKSKSKNKSKK